MPAGKGGRGNKTPTPTVGVYPPATISAYRKLAANRDQLDEYYESTHTRETLLVLPTSVKLIKAPTRARATLGPGRTLGLSSFDGS